MDARIEKLKKSEAAITEIITDTDDNMEKIINRIWSVKNIRNSEKFYANKIHVITFFENLPLKKLEVLKKAETRNGIFTSEYTLEHVNIEILDIGIYFKLTGCQCSFNIFCDFDGNIRNKPKKAITVREISCNEYKK
jgi:hypothetical protein